MLQNEASGRDGIWYKQNRNRRRVQEGLLIMRKQFLPAFALLLLLLLPIAAGAESSGKCGNSINWTLSDQGVLTISGSGTITGHPWTVSDVTEIVIEPGITGIGSYVFQDSASLERISLPGSLKSIGASAFNGCEKINAITVSSIESWLSISCADNNSSHPNYLKHNINSGIRLYMDGAEVTAVTVPDGITSIGCCAFRGFSHLASVVIPDGVETIGEHAFSGCGSLKGLTIPDSVTRIESCAFRDCAGLTHISVPEGVTALGTYAFDGCSSLKSITLPDRLTDISYCAFSGCKSLR